jgi:hypothetical protein
VLRVINCEIPARYKDTASFYKKSFGRNIIALREAAALKTTFVTTE